MRLITEPAYVKAVICENYEDVLIEHYDGSFVGLQIKTRKLTLSEFKATDDAVQKSLIRFCQLEALFPGTFSSFDFTTNHWFWENAENDKNLPWLLKTLKERRTTKRLRAENPLKKFVDALVQKTGLKKEIVESALCKVILNGYAEPIDTIDMRVISAVGECPSTRKLSYAQNVKIAQEIISNALDASSKKLKDATIKLYSAGCEFSEVLDNLLLCGKTISKGDIEAIIDSLSKLSEPLKLSGIISIESLPPHLAVMIQKLDKGGLQAGRIDQMTDLVKSFEFLFIKWVKKYGAEKAQERYVDLLAKVSFDCTESQVEADTKDIPYAPQMYKLLFDRLRKRVADVHDELYGCTPEHMLGAAGVLTQQCKVWWSPKFDVQETS